MNLVVALNFQSIIGKNNALPWRLKGDLERFKLLTNGNIVVMGRKTYESLPESKRPLPNRFNVVITSNPDKYEKKDNLYFTTLDKSIEFLDNLQKDKGCKVFIIGGNSIYSYFMDYIHTFHLTKVNLQFNKSEEDNFVYFPKALSSFGEDAFWSRFKMIYEKHGSDVDPLSKKKVDYKFVTYELIV